ncbi:MAG: alpha/beta hydrolase [Chloroflexi bacterium]|nr:alpha/beta hydrolase [Chloroflexota bacterium]
MNPRGRVFLIAALVIAGLLAAGLIYQTVASAADRRNLPPRGELVAMGGYDLHLHCTGDGSPTVVLIAGAGDIAVIWEPVQQGLSPETRVCSYDRPGLGWSDYAPVDEMTIEAQMTILHDLLQNAGETGPYIVVGHSIGGVMARTFAAMYPAETAGVVLVDSSVESQFAALPAAISETNRAAGAVFTVCRALAPFGVVRLLGLGDARAETFDVFTEDAQARIAATFHQTRGCAALQRDGAVADEPLASGDPPAPLGDVPLVVITGALPEHEVNPQANYSEEQVALFNATQTIWLDLQEGLTDLSTDSTWIIAERSGHYVHADQPELVTDAVGSLLAE